MALKPSDGEKSDTIGRLPHIQELITQIRQGRDVDTCWTELKNLVESNTEEICREADTRWLVSILDTYVDCGTDIERRNALLVVQIANFEKLWATNLLMYDVSLNPEKVNQLKKNKVIHLWDGMYSFNINHGDMSGNFFGRLETLLVATPAIRSIYQVVIERLKASGMTLANLNEYHRRLFEPYPRRSVFRLLRKKIINIFKNYKI